jgi:hypothetical protein
MPRPGDDVGDRAGDVLGLHCLPELAADALEHLGPVELEYPLTLPALPSIAMKDFRSFWLGIRSPAAA